MRTVNSFAREQLSGLAIAGGRSSTAVLTACALGPGMRTAGWRMPMVFALFVPSAPRRETRDLAPSVAVGAGANAPSADIVSSAVVEDGWVDARGGVCEASPRGCCLVPTRISLRANRRAAFGDRILTREPRFSFSHMRQCSKNATGGVRFSQPRHFRREPRLRLLATTQHHARSTGIGPPPPPPARRRALRARRRRVLLLLASGADPAPSPRPRPRVQDGRHRGRPRPASVRHAPVVRSGAAGGEVPAPRQLLLRPRAVHPRRRRRRGGGAQQRQARRRRRRRHQRARHETSRGAGR